MSTAIPLPIVILCLGACASSTGRTTVRMVDGLPQTGRYVAPEAYSLYLQAEVAINRGDRPRALQRLRDALSHDPDAPYLHTRLATVMAALDRTAEAEVALAKALRLRPGFPDALLLKARIAESQGKRREAQGALQDCIAANPHEPAAYLAMGRLLQEQGQVDAARKLLQRLALQQPDLESGHRALALLCLRQLDYRCAADSYQRVLQLNTALAPLLRLAHVKQALDDKKAAIRLLREAFDRSGGHLSIAAKLAQLLADAEQPGAVDDLLEVLVQQAHDDPEVLSRIGEIGLTGRRPATVLQSIGPGSTAPALTLIRAAALRQQSRLAEARTLIEPLVGGTLGPAAAIALAEVLEEQGETQRAVSLLRDALKRAPEHEPLILALAGVLERAGRAREAIDLARRAFDAQKSRRLRFGLAMLLERNGRWRQAVQLMDQLLEESPNDPSAHNFIGYSHADHGGDLELAARAIRRANFLSPGESYIIDSLGWLYFRQGHLAKARQALLIAARVAPRDAEVIAHLAEVSAALKQLPQALQLFRRALKLSKDKGLRQRLRAHIARLTKSRVGRRR